MAHLSPAPAALRSLFGAGLLGLTLGVAPAALLAETDPAAVLAHRLRFMSRKTSTIPPARARASTRPSTTTSTRPCSA